MNTQQPLFWKSEGEMLDRLYHERIREWQRGGDQWHPNRLDTRRQELEVAYRQTAGAIAGLCDFAPQEEAEEPEVAENGQAPELEWAEA